MADFRRALVRTLGHEGHYSNDPSDRGGETYRGITRRDHPDWPGWAIVDEAKQAPEFPRGLAGNEELERLSAELYKRRYWDRFLGDDVPDQAIAEELFDTGVNAGVGRAVTWLQEALNALNDGQRRWPDVKEDGQLGPATLRALTAAKVHARLAAVLTLQNVLQGAHYARLARHDVRQERFMRGWLNRVQLTTTPVA